MKLSRPRLASHYTSIWFDSISLFSFYTWLCSRHFQVFWLSHGDTDMCLLMKQRDVSLSEPSKEIPESLTAGTGSEKFPGVYFVCVYFCIFFFVFSLCRIQIETTAKATKSFPCSFRLCHGAPTGLCHYSVKLQCNLNLPYMLLYVGWRNTVSPIPD